MCICSHMRMSMLECVSFFRLFSPIFNNFYFIFLIFTVYFSLTLGKKIIFLLVRGKFLFETKIYCQTQRVMIPPTEPFIWKNVNTK